MPKPHLLFSFLILLMLIFAYEAKPQRFLGGVALGMNITQVDGDEYYGFHKVGLNAGPMVSMPFGKNRNWSATMELLYSQKGSNHKGSSDTTTFRLVQDYAEVPLIVHYTDKKLISGGLGFAYGQLVNYKETSNNFYDTIYRYQTGLSNYELSVIADVKIRLWSKLWGNLRYQYSMKSNRTVDVHYPYPRQVITRDQFNNVITLRVIWVFNQEKIAKKPKK